MAFLSRLFSTQNPIERRDVQLSRGLIETLRNESQGIGAITPNNALQQATVFACTKVLSEAIGQLPLILYKRLARGKERAKDHYLYPILHSLPNSELTSAEIRMILMGHAVIWGNAYAQLIRNGAGQIVEWWPLNPSLMTVQRAPNGKLVYEYNSQADGHIVFLKDEIFHLRGFGGDGMGGYSVIKQARIMFEGVEATSSYGSKFYENGARPGMIMQHPGKLSQKAYEKLIDSWEARHAGIANSHRIAILEEGMTVAEVGIPPSDAQFLETRRFQRAEISALFRVPLHMINDLERSAFSNIEQQSLEFVIYTLGPWLALWEQAIYRDFFTELERKRYFAEFLVDGLLRGDTLSRYQAHQIAILGGFLTPNEAREMDNRNPLDGGDDLLLPMNTSAGNPTGTTGKAKEQPKESKA